jgi:hypothetical protein
MPMSSKSKRSAHVSALPCSETECIKVGHAHATSKQDASDTRAPCSQSIAFPLIAYIRVAQVRCRTDTPRVGTKAESDRHAANAGASP